MQAANVPSSRRRHDKQREKRRSLALQAQLSFLSAAVVYKRGLVQTLRNCRTRARIMHTRTTSTVVVSTTPSQPAAGEQKFHACEVEVAFKMTHLRMAYSSRSPSTTNQAENARQPASAHHDGPPSQLHRRRSAWIPDLSATHTLPILSKG